MIDQSGEYVRFYHVIRDGKFIDEAIGMMAINGSYKNSGILTER